MVSFGIFGHKNNNRYNIYYYIINLYNYVQYVLDGFPITTAPRTPMGSPNRSTGNPPTKFLVEPETARSTSGGHGVLQNGLILFLVP
jgi:hypothetical protein